MKKTAFSSAALALLTFALAPAPPAGSAVTRLSPSDVGTVSTMREYVQGAGDGFASFKRMEVTGGDEMETRWLSNRPVAGAQHCYVAEYRDVQGGVVATCSFAFGTFVAAADRFFSLRSDLEQAFPRLGGSFERPRAAGSDVWSNGVGLLEYEKMKAGGYVVYLRFGSPKDLMRFR